MFPKVSVIIPVYNVEKYIIQCANSLFRQTIIYGIEFIFINDNTPDRSIELLLDLLDEFPWRKAQVKIIHHSCNQGLMKTRCTGIKEAMGEYIICCDSDDWIEMDMYEKMYNKAKSQNADIVQCNYIEERKGFQKKRSMPEWQDKKKIIKAILNPYSHEIEGFLWNRMIKRSFYIESLKYNIKGNINYFEDLFFIIPIYLQVSKIGYVNEALYHYRKTNTLSITYSLSPDKIESMIRVIDFLEDFFIQNHCLDIFKEELDKNKFEIKEKAQWYHMEKANMLWPTIKKSPKIPLKKRLEKWLHKHNLSFIIDYCYTILFAIKSILICLPFSRLQRMQFHQSMNADSMDNEC